MATINNPQDEQQQQPGQPLAVNGTGGASAAGGQGAGVGAAAPQSPVAQNQAPQANTGYTDVGTYLDANKQGSSKLGDMVSSNLTNQYNTTKSGIDSSAQSTKDAANKGYVQQNTDLINQVAADPTAVDQSRAGDVQAQLNDSYTGPQNWADMGTQQGKANEAMQEGALTTTPGGINVLSQQAEGGTGGPQSQGINQLDTLLLGSSPDAMGKVQAAADPFKGLNDYINSQNTAIGQTIGSSQAAAQKAQDDARTALLGPSGATGQLDAQLQSQLSSAIQSGATSNAEIMEAAKNQDFGSLVQRGVLTQDQANQLSSAVTSAQTSQYMTGHNFGAASATAPVDLGSYITQKDPNAVYNLNNTANADQFARSQAFQKLLGDANYKSQLTDPSQVGKAVDPKTLSVMDYLDATKNASDFGTQARAQAQAQADALTANAEAEHNASKSHTFGGALTKAATIGGKYLANPMLAVPDSVQAVSTTKDKISKINKS